MKTRRYFLTTVLAAIILFAGCSKDDTPAPPRQDPYVALLTRTWKIQEVYLNGTLQPLTTQQSTYWVRYSQNAGEIDKGSFLDKDGFNGVWAILQPEKDNLPKKLQISFSDPLTASLTVVHTINELTAVKLDISCTVNTGIRRDMYVAQ